VAGPTTALEDAVALLTVAMHAGGFELDALVEEFEAKGRSSDLLHAMVALCRSLCFTTAKLVHALDDQLTSEEVLDLTDADVRAAALEVVRAYARAAAPTGDVATP
jgi:hypothetical protein